MTGVYRGVRKDKKDVQMFHSMVLTGATKTQGREEIFWCRNSYGDRWGQIWWVLHGTQEVVFIQLCVCGGNWTKEAKDGPGEGPEDGPGERNGHGPGVGPGEEVGKCVPENAQTTEDIGDVQ